MKPSEIFNAEHCAIEDIYKGLSLDCTRHGHKVGSEWAKVYHLRYESLKRSSKKRKYMSPMDVKDAQDCATQDLLDGNAIDPTKHGHAIDSDWARRYTNHFKKLIDHNGLNHDDFKLKPKPVIDRLSAFPCAGGFNGMELRDYFAAKAMQAYLSQERIVQDWGEEVAAEASYRAADAMMKARKG